MHGNVVPAHQKLPSSKAAAGLLPSPHNVIHDHVAATTDARTLTPSERQQIDTFGVVIELAFVNRETGRLRKGPRQTLGIEEIGNAREMRVLITRLWRAVLSVTGPVAIQRRCSTGSVAGAC